MDRKTSQKIKHISFFAILMVVVSHSYCIQEAEAIDYTFNYWVQNFIAKGLFTVDVPSFFFISGFLFFCNFSGKLSEVITKYRRRVDSLLLPYIFWCGLWFLVVFLLQVLPISKNFFNQPLYQMSMADNFWNAFYEPINYPFWFIRELIFYILIIPLLYFVPKKMQILFLLVIFGISLAQTSLVTIWKVSFLHYSSFVLFVAGSIAGLRKYSLIFKLELYQWLLMSMVWATLIICRILNIFNEFPIFMIDLLSKIEVIIGILTLWLGYDLLPESFKKIKSDVYSFTFIIFAFHGIPLVIVKKLFFKIFDRTPYWELIGFVTIPTFSILLSILVGKLLFKKIPGFYMRIIGGRKISTYPKSSSV